MSLSCDRGHANPPGSAFCTVCGLALSQAAPQAPGAMTPGTPPPPPGAYPPPPPPPGMPPPPPDAYPPPAAPWQQAPGAGSPGFPWKPVALGVGIAVGVLGLVLVVVNLLGGGSRNIDVNFTVYGVEGCDLGLGYMDVPGSTVIIKADGELAGSGSLTQFGSDEGFSCEFTSVVLDVPDDASLYSVEVGSRGVVTSTRAELEGNGWAFDLSLGL